jgi:phosphoenolpyruvate synthase/pyruvate phosphate dikinase
MVFSAKEKWVKNFGIRASVLTIYALAKGHKYINKVYGLPICLDYKYIDGEEFRKAEYLQKINNIVRQDVKKWVRLIVDKLSLIVDEFELFCQEEKEYNTNLRVYDDYKEFFKRYSYFVGICDVPVFIDEAVSEKILNELKKRKVKNIDKYFQILTTYLKNLYIIQENNDFLTLVIKVNKKKNLFLNNLKEFKKTALYQEILNHHSRYSWMGFRLLLGKELTLDYFLKKIRENMSTAQNQVNRILNKKRKDKGLFKRTVNKLKLDNDLLQCGQLLMWIRDKRYVGITRGGFYKRKLFKEIAQRLKVSQEDVLYLLPKEIKAALINGKKINKNLIIQRKKRYVLLMKNGRVGNLIVGKKLTVLKREDVSHVNELKGRSANSGRASGVVRVVIYDKDLAKFKAGEVLVTNMTTPDYITAMKKAAAIVTDLGGITCHAAIISRELNIPCIVDTKIATKVFKDGDLVEVDANKGTVKLLKK